MRFFEVKVKLDKVQADGTTKTVSETYALDAMTFTDAEARITKEMQPFITGDFEVMVGPDSRNVQRQAFTLQ